MRQCKACGETKPITEFYTRPDSKDGYRNTCKHCTNNSTLSKIIDETGNRYGKWLVMSRDTASSYTIRWLCKCDCGNYKSVLGTALRNSTSSSCGCNKAHTKSRSNKSIYNCFYRSYKNGAASRNYIFNITLEEFLIIINSNCHYCGQTPSDVKFFYSRKGKDETHFVLVNGVDRVDNNKGYINGNIVPCCKICNSMKSNLTYNDFIDKISKIYDNLKDKNNEKISNNKTDY